MLKVNAYYPLNVALRDGSDRPGRHVVELSADDLAALAPSTRERLAAYVQPGTTAITVQQPTKEGVLDAIREEARIHGEAYKTWKAQLLQEPSRLWRMVRSLPGTYAVTQEGAFCDEVPRISSLTIGGVYVCADSSVRAALLADPDLVAVMDRGREETQREADELTAVEARKRQQEEEERARREADRQARREQEAAREQARVAWLEASAAKLDLDDVLVRAAKEDRDAWPEVRKAVLDRLHTVVMDALSVLPSDVQRDIGLLASAHEVNVLRVGRSPERRPRPSRVAYAVYDRLREGNLASMMSLQIDLGCTITVDDIVRVNVASRVQDPIYSITAVQITFHAPLLWDDEAIQFFVPCERVDEDKVNGEWPEEDGE